MSLRMPTSFFQSIVPRPAAKRLLSATWKSNRRLPALRRASLDVELFHVNVIGVEADAAFRAHRVGQSQRLLTAIEQVGFEAIERLYGDAHADLLGVGETFACGVDHPLPLFLFRAVGNNLADGCRHKRDDLAIQFAHHGEHVFHILHRSLALALVPCGKVALAQHQCHRAPAADAVLFQRCAGFLRLVLLRLAGNLDGFVAECLDPAQRRVQRLGAHPVVCRKMHKRPSSRKSSIRPLAAGTMSQLANQFQSGSTNFFIFGLLLHSQGSIKRRCLVSQFLQILYFSIS